MDHGDGRTRIVGRQCELARLNQIIESVTAGSWRLVEILGEPGIGKTHLLGTFSALAAGGGFRVISGRATEFERDVPFGVFVDAVNDSLRALPDPERAALRELGGGLLAAIFPALRYTAPVPDGIPPGQRHALFQAVGELIGRLAAGSGLVLLLDDVHWVDAASADLLTYLVRHPPPAAVAFTIAYRPRQLPVKLAAALQYAASAGGGQRLELGPLSRTEAAALVGPMSPARCAALYAEAEGNPFYLQALRWASPRAGLTGPASPAGRIDGPPPADWPGQADTLDIPHPVRVALLAEIEALPAEPRLVAEAAAVAGDLVVPDLTAAIAELDEREVLAALDELEARDILRQLGTSRRFAFRHPIVRHVFYQASRAGWKLGAHARAAATLAELAAPAQIRAPHVERSARQGDLAAVELLVRAADGVCGYAPAEAAHWYQAARRLLPAEDCYQARYLDLLSRLAESLGAAGQFGAAREMTAELLRLLPPEAGAARTEAATYGAMLEHQLGRSDQALALLRSELDQLDPDSPLAASLLLEACTHYLVKRDYVTQRRYARKAYACASRHGDLVGMATAQAMSALADCWGGAVPAAQQSVAEAAAVLDRLTDAELTGALDLVVALSWPEIFLDQIGTAERHLVRGIELARGTGHTAQLAPMLIELADVKRCTGRLVAAASDAQHALEAALVTGSDELRMLAIVKQGEIALERDDPAAAQQCAEEAMNLVPAQGSNKFQAPLLLGLVWILTGRYREGRDLVLEAAGGDDLPLVPQVIGSRVYEQLVEAERRLGRPAAAARWAQLAWRMTEPLGLDMPLGYAQLARARAEADADPAAALAAVDRAVRLFDGLGDRLGVAAGQALAGGLLARLGERERSAAAFDRAGAGFRDCGAPLRAEHLAGSRTGDLAGPPDAAAAPPARPLRLGLLSQRELQVARLIANGDTNRQIARALSVKENTVEVHVGNILRKLGVRSRAAVASIVTLAEHTGPVVPAGPVRQR